MATELKTKQHEGSVLDFLNGIENETRREDGLAVLEMMQTITGETPKMWGTSIVGFGEYTYKYASGRTGDWMVIGFSPRKQNLSLYGFGQYTDLLSKLGKHKTSGGCVTIQKLADVDQEVLRELITVATAAGGG